MQKSRNILKSWESLECSLQTKSDFILEGY